MESKNFVVYKSSAGSGKTYTLVKEYLKLVLSNPAQVRRILAITFTNAASAEMKERIIKALAEIVDYKKGNLDPESKNDAGIRSLIGQLVSETSLDEAQILNNSEKVLFFILHNYNDFSISTIDSFTHRILRTFAYDLKIPVNFEIEFDIQQTIEQAADILISKTGAGLNPELTNLLVRFIESRTDEERSFVIEREIIEMASKMLKEDSINYIEKLKENDINDFIRANKTIKSKLEDIKKRIVEPAEESLNIIKESDISIKSLAYGDRGIYSWFKKLADGRIEESFPPGKYVEKTLEENKWHSNKAEQEGDVEKIYSIATGLQSKAENIISFAEENIGEYILLENINNKLFSLALINEMEKTMDAIRLEENILFIADFNKMISGVVANEPVPFIYERVGEKYRNYMIDEFQDTSVLQWQNMLPLVENSIAGRNMSLLVGDAKQSIYRWRGGDAQQFVKLPELTDKIFSINKEQIEGLLKASYRQVPENPDEETVNYRSEENIVKFNNDFFEEIKPQLPELVREVYKGHKQQCNKPGSGGYVEISFITETRGEKERFEKETTQKVQSIIEKLVSGKHNYSDIAVLCRKKKEAAAVANQLTQNGYYVVSEESLLLSGSEKINFLISLMRLINNPEDSPALTVIVNFLLKNDIIKKPEKLHVCLNELFDGHDNGNEKLNSLERFIILLKNNGLNIPSTFFSSNTVYEMFEEAVRLFFSGQKNICPYLTFFFDCVHEYQKTRQNNITSFLRYWDEKKDSFSLVIPDKLDAVKVITIHKSKGLQFPVVIYPFAKETSSINREDGFWIDVENKDIAGLKAAYIGARKSLTKTGYSELYTYEEESRILDLINLTYVAFTRPREQLYVISSLPENGKFPKNSLNTILHGYLVNKRLWNDDRLVYSFPDKKEHYDVTENHTDNKAIDKEYKNWLSQFIIQPWKNKVSACLIDEPGEPEQVKRVTRGKAIHKAMESIFSPKDIPLAVERLIAEGYILKDESETLQKNISELLNNSLIKTYFSDEHEMRTEPGIFDSSGKFYRPDRIVFTAQETAVLDYKTGLPHDKHKHQVRKYGKLLEEMNYKNVKLFIVYIDQNVIEEIER